MDYLSDRERDKTYFRWYVIHFMWVFPGIDLAYYSEIILIISNVSKIN